MAVYIPQSYNFAGNLIIIPKERVTPLDVPSGEVMTFLVSGGVSGKDDGKKDGGKPALPGVGGKSS